MTLYQLGPSSSKGQSSFGARASLTDNYRPSKKPKLGKAQKYYGVKRGRMPGVYSTWEEAEAQVKGYPGALHESFPNYGLAAKFVGKLPTPIVRSKSSGRTLVELNDSEEEIEPMLDRKPSTSEKLGESSKSASNLPASAPKVELPPPPADPGPAKEPELSTQQREILDRIIAGENYFFTGSAGTGKSVLLRAIMKEFRSRDATASQTREELLDAKWADYVQGKGKPGANVDRWKLGVCASTGMAAVNIGGTTVHSWAGIGLGEKPVDQLVTNIKANNVTRARWESTGALIIDEVSMIDGDLFDKLEQIARRVRKSMKPFGGLQLIVSGDFYQLPPVAKHNGPPFKFAFEAKAWSRCFPRENMSALTRVFRQKEDDFVRLLEGMRKGFVSQADVARLRKCERAVPYPDGVEAVGLYPSKAEVENINNKRLAALQSPLCEFTAYDEPGVNSRGFPLSPQEATMLLDRNTIWPKQLALKVGALVMLVTNLGDGALVNGSTGESTHNSRSYWADEPGKVVDFMTVSQATAQHVYIAQRGGYSRPDDRVQWPVIEFVPSKHAATKIAPRTLIPSMSVDVINAQGQKEAERHQVPLILAWALTIHKSQGQTIERVKIDLARIFVEGQTYVAISRAVSLDNLEIRNFSASKVMAHRRVIEWAAPIEAEQADDEKWDELLQTADLDF